MVEIGNTNFWYGETDRHNPTLTWDIASGATSRRPGTKVVMQKWEAVRFHMVDLAFVKSRFDYATANKALFDYGVWLMHEEIWHPAREASFGSSIKKIVNWQIDGKITLAGVELKLIKTWIIENKNQPWNQTWWNGVVSGNKYNDPLVWEWSDWYGLQLYKAWHQHMRNLGKGSAIIGLGNLCGASYGCFDADLNRKYTPAQRDYIMSNYDVLTSYGYPRSTAEIRNSVEQISTFRKYGFKGKIIHILTSSFKASWYWNWSEAVAWEEFKTVAPLVDVIVTYYFAQDTAQQTGAKILYVPLLLKFFSQYTQQPQPTMYTIHLLNVSGGGCVKLNDKDLYCGSDVGLQEPAGSQFKLEAIPNNGYTFDHWILGGLTYNDPIVTGVMNANKEYAIYFKPAPGPDPEPQPAKPDLVKPIIIIIGGSILKDLFS